MCTIPNPEEPILLTLRQTADLLGVTTNTLRAWVALGKLPQPVRPSATANGMARPRPFFVRSEVLDAIAKMRSA